MSKVEISVILAGTAACALLGYGFVTMERPHDVQNLKTTTQGAAAASVRPFSPAAGDSTPGTTDDAGAVPAVKLLPVDATHVPDQTLLRLSGMVDIANAVSEHPDKTAWREALPVAEGLLACPCDCAQRNWLKHFVETGHCALEGSEDEYHQAAGVLVTLGRNNEQAVALSKPGN